MLNILRTDSEHEDFRNLVKELDHELRIRDGEEHAFFAQFNKIDLIQHVVLVFDGDVALGCGAVKAYNADKMEVKRMFVPLAMRGKGIASMVLAELEKWTQELGYKGCILETGIRQPEAIALYKKNHYQQIKNYGQYEQVESSVCFEKLFV
jgi:GNAT superfamily N-acetyltransferase